MIASHQPARFLRLSPFVAGIALLVASTHSFAQTTVRMTTTQSTACVAVTDGGGVTLVPGSTDLQASGVTLTGSGCGTPAATNFSPTVSAPASVTVGAQFNVAWSAPADATQCFYLTPATGVSGWAAGTSACSTSANCSAPHSVPVTINAAGTYSFSLACTNASGAGSSNGVVATGAPPPAPTPADFPLTVSPAAPVAGTPFSVAWSVANADQCIATVSGAATTLTGWDTVTTATSPRTVTAAAGTYTLGLTCKNGSGQVSSQATTVVVSPVAGACVGPAGLTRLQTSNITYSVLAATRPNVNVTEWDNIWGHFTSTDNVLAWPGYNGSFVVMTQFARTNFIAAHFKTPANASSASTMSGFFVHPVNQPGPDADMKISTTCGDFAPDISNPACLVTNVATSDEKMVKWKFTPGNLGSYCVLAPNTDYYVNIKLSDPASTVECAAGATICPMPMAQQFGGSF